MDFQIITPASTAPVSVADLNTHLQLFGDTSYDLEMAGLILTAQEYVSDHLGEFVTATVVRVPLADFEDVVLTHKNVSNISVSYYDTNNTVQTLATSEYVVDTSGIKTRISFKSAPVVSTDFDNKAYVQYTAGYSNVPLKVKHAILMAAAELFEVRTETTDAKQRKAEITIHNLLRSYKRW